MKKFGIEIRKSGTLGGLYDDVDQVLSDNKITREYVGDSVVVQTCAHALNKMLKSDKYMDVCTIRKCAEVTGIVIAKERENIYSAVHCVHWSEMTPEYRKLLTAMVLDDFRPVLNPQP